MSSAPLVPARYNVSILAVGKPKRNVGIGQKLLIKKLWDFEILVSSPIPT